MLNPKNSMAAMMVLGGIKMEAKLTTVSHMKELSNSLHEHVIFRQTRNWHTRRWNCVQRQQSDGKWRKIVNERKVIHPKQGWAFALWRVGRKMRAKKDIYGRRQWNVSVFKIRHGVYMTYYLVCFRKVHSFQGTY